MGSAGWLVNLFGMFASLANMQNTIKVIPLNISSAKLLKSVIKTKTKS